MRLIDADTLVYRLTEEIRRSTGEYKYGLQAARLLTMEAPTVARDINVPDNGWISADKRPPRQGRYLVWGKTEFVPDHKDEPCGCCEIKIANWSDKWGWDCKVKRWRPLPEPPEEGDT